MITAVLLYCELPPPLVNLCLYKCKHSREHGTMSSVLYQVSKYDDYCCTAVLWTRPPPSPLTLGCTSVKRLKEYTVQYHMLCVKTS